MKKLIYQRKLQPAALHGKCRLMFTVFWQLNGLYTFNHIRYNDYSK